VKIAGAVSVCLLVVMIVVSGTVTPAQQQAAPMDEAALTKEVNAFMDNYWRLWSAGEIDQLAAQIYHPFGQLSNGGHATIEQMKSSFPQSRKTMLAAGYGRSQMPMPQRNVCILAPSVAVISGRGVRYLTDGKVMAEFGWTYTLLRTANGWRMVSIYSHDPNRALVCK
jgi:hypothetical protein